MLTLSSGNIVITYASDICPSRNLNMIDTYENILYSVRVDAGVSSDKKAVSAIPVKFKCETRWRC